MDVLTALLALFVLKTMRRGLFRIGEPAVAV
jgi:hypothetical protein